MNNDVSYRPRKLYKITGSHNSVTSHRTVTLGTDEHNNIIITVVYESCFTNKLQLFTFLCVWFRRFRLSKLTDVLLTLFQQYPYKKVVRD